MISNERKWPSRFPPQRPQRPQRQPYPYQQTSPPAPRPYVQEDTIKSAELQVERKHISMLLKENVRGRFLRIAEETNGRHNSIIIPASGLRDFQKLIEEIVKADSEIPSKNQPQQQP